MILLVFFCPLIAFLVYKSTGNPMGLWLLAMGPAYLVGCLLYGIWRAGARGPRPEDVPDDRVWAVTRTRSGKILVANCSSTRAAFYMQTSVDNLVDGLELTGWKLRETTNASTKNQPKRGARWRENMAG